jgi:hypothetical protein
MEKLTITHSIKDGLKIKISIPSDTVLELSVSTSKEFVLKNWAKIEVKMG